MKPLHSQDVVHITPVLVCPGCVHRPICCCPGVQAAPSLAFDNNHWGHVPSSCIDTGQYRKAFSGACCPADNRLGPTSCQHQTRLVFEPKRCLVAVPNTLRLLRQTKGRHSPLQILHDNNMYDDVTLYQQDLLQKFNFIWICTERRWLHIQQT